MSVDTLADVAIVTGACSGIGLALSKHLISLGYHVFMADINPNGAAVVASIIGDTTNASDEIVAAKSPVFVQADVSSWPSQLSLFAHAYAVRRRIALFVANAGIPEQEDLISHIHCSGIGEPSQPGTRTLDVNLHAIIDGLRLFVHYTRKSRIESVNRNPRADQMARMLVTSSIAAIYAYPAQPVYSATKHGLNGLVRSMGKSLRAENMTVNAIMPSAIQTTVMPKQIWDVFVERGVATPMSTVIQAFERFLEGGVASSVSGECVEACVDAVYVRDQHSYPCEAERFVIEDPEGLWGSYRKGR